MNKQPEALALRLADSLRNTFRWHELTDDECDAAAAELRRLHAENQALNDALQYSMGCHLEMSELAVRQRARLDELEPQVDQEPVAWVGVGFVTWDGRQSEKVEKLTREAQPEYGFVIPIYTHPQPKRDASGKPDEWFDRLKSTHSWK